jgi:hypothetical protein
MRTKAHEVAKRSFNTGDMLAVTGVAPGTGVAAGTLHEWCQSGALGAALAGPRGSGVNREYTVEQVLAVACAVAWQRAGADPFRVASVLRFLAWQPLEHIEAEIAAGRTFPVPQIMLKDEFIMPVPGTGIFIEPQKEGPAARLFAELDLGVIWARVKAAIARLPASRPRGRRPRK